jgi:small subunit ribosomal protein S17
MKMKKETKKRRLKGIVGSDKMSKTVVVIVSTKKKHPRYLKYFTQSARFKAHDEENECQVGDAVVIEETRPLSRDKRWRVVERYPNTPKIET